MTDVPGVLRNKDDPSTKFTSLTIRECKELQDQGIIAGGMIPKVIYVQLVAGSHFCVRTVLLTYD
jgi:acetylglutamate kinase